MTSTELAGWPAVGREERPWRSRYEPGEASRREVRAHAGPYVAAVVPPIAAATLHLPGEVATAVGEAEAEIARFDQELGAALAPFHAVLLRSESAASSQIENLTASARAIAEASLGEGRGGSSNAALVLANTAAMQAAVALADDLSADSILAMHRALMADHAPTIAGRWRDEQVWIGGGRLGPHRALFVPPHHERVPAAIDDLVAFMARDDLPPLAHAAVAHAQFETIHPFPDGNGRTGRALAHAMLRHRALTRQVTVPVSAGLLADVGAYFAALDAYRGGDPLAIVTLLAGASFAAVANGRRLAGDLRAVRASWDDRVRARRDSHTWRIADLLLAQPVVDAALVARELGIKRPNVYAPLEPLVEAGVLLETTDRRRGRIWRSIEVLDAVDAFAARAGSRRRG